MAGALERNKGGNCYPIGWYNITWKEMLKMFHKYMGVPDKKIITLPTFLFKFGLIGMRKKQKKHGVEGGVHMVKFSKLQCSKQYIDKSLGCEFLGVTDDDIDAAIGESVSLSCEILDKKLELVAMMITPE